MPIHREDFEQLETTVLKKSTRRKRKRTRKPKMKVSGKSVFRLRAVLGRSKR